MAQGYDTRQATRQSFAFQPPAPVQTNAAPSGQQRTARVEGGNSQSGMIAAGPQTDPGAIAGPLGQFFGELMQPYVERKQQAAFFKGFTRAQAGDSLDELDKSNKGLGKIFGPTSFEDGAQFYKGHEALSKWQTEAVTNIDELKRLTPDELAEVLAEKSRAMMTGHGDTDRIIQTGLMQATGPLVSTITKARYAWQQDTAKLQVSSAWAAGASALQASVVAASALTDPTDADNKALGGLVSTFRSSLMKPAGMDEDSYKDSLYGFMANSSEAGNFYAVQVAKAAGIMEVFDDKQKEALEVKYEKYAKKAQALASGDPSINEAIIELETGIKMGRVTGVDVMAGYSKINGMINRLTGVQGLDLFDADEIRSGVSDVTSLAVATLRRNEDKAERAAERAEDRRLDAAEDAAEEDAVAAQVNIAWTAGDMQAGIVGGIKPSDADMLAYNDYQQGNFKNIVKQYANGYVSTRVASTIQESVNATLTPEYNNGFKSAYEGWAKMNAASRTTAAKYYGQHHTAFQKFDKLTKGGTLPTNAYIRSFGDPATYGEADIPPARRKEVTEQVETYIGSLGTKWYNLIPGLGKVEPNTSAKAVIAAGVRRSVGIASKNSDLPTATLTADAIQEQVKSNATEIIGRHAWANAPGTPRLSSLLGLQAEDTAAVFSGAMNYYMKKAGYAPGEAGENYDIIRAKGPDGKAIFHIQEKDDDGQAISVIITQGQLEATRDAWLKAKTPQAVKAKPKAKPDNTAYINRRIKGETVTQRVIRINRETAQ